MTNIKEKIQNGWVQAIIIIEILGRPADYVKESIEKAVETIGREKGVEIVKKEIHPAKEIEGQKDVFSTFAEIELLTENYKRLVEIVFTYFPVSIEIIEPQELRWKREDASLFLNDLISRIHKYDTIAKTIILQNAALKNQLKELQKLQPPVTPSKEPEKADNQPSDKPKKKNKK